MRNMVRWTGLIGAIALSGLGGCYGRRPGPGVDPTQATTLRVDNQAFNDMNVYVVSEGQQILFRPQVNRYAEAHSGVADRVADAFFG